ncbi:hypothetical protein ABIA03_003223 [Bradyrhizobium yuanmingense]|uniref:Uncharacterized protein n=1 Tax=Bradyrhizobium yuanmingense TaxID=108015 RepID=A0ABV4GG68_9BRAD
MTRSGSSLHDSILWLWIPGSRQARPGMTAESVAQLTIKPLPECTNRRPAIPAPR